MKASTKTQKPKLPAKIAKPAASKRRPSQLTRPTRRSLFAPRKRTVLVILIICFATILASALYARHQADLNSQTKQDQAYEDDKAQFTKVEAEMQTAYDAMIAAAGTPDKSSQSKSCSHVSLKFEEGQLNCGLGYHFVYGVEDRQEMQALSNKINDGISKAEIFKPSSGSESLASISNTNNLITVYLKESTYSSCELNATFNTSKLSQYEGIRSTYVADFVFSCVRDVTLPVYPLAE